MNTKIVGIIEKINPIVQVTEKFSKREVVVTTEGDYPQVIMVQFSQDKCNIPDSYNEGDNVEISVNIKGRKWISPNGEEKYFVSLDAWAMFKQGSLPKNTEGKQNNRMGNIESNFQEEAIREMQEDDDDLPF